MGKDCACFQPSLRDERLRYLYPALKRRATLNASLRDANTIPYTFTRSICAPMDS